MPTYQYACRSCDHRFDAVQNFHEEALRVCPECESEELRKLFGNVGVVFKGSGFYRNDSRSGADKARSSGKSGSAGSSTSSTASTSSTSSTSGNAGGTSSTSVAKPAGDSGGSKGSSKAPAAG